MMPYWGIVLIYAGGAVLFGALYQLFFRYRFRELFYMYSFFTIASLILAAVMNFTDVYLWIAVVNVLCVVVVGVCFFLYYKLVVKKLKGHDGARVLAMLKQMAKKRRRERRKEKREPSPDIVVTDERAENFPDETQYEKFYDMGDIIIGKEQELEKRNEKGEK